MYNRVIKFPINQRIEQDESGFQTESYDWIENVPACFKNTTRQDEILAQQVGYTADIIVEIDAANYPGSAFFVDMGTGDEYFIRRTYTKETSRTLQMTAERRERGTCQS